VPIGQREGIKPELTGYLDESLG
ncbi:MAG: hypothetical protein RL507_995, partial [Actinomycetota bacterium]